MPNRILSLREFARLAKLDPMTVKYHIKRGHIQTTTRITYGINEDQLEVIKRFTRNKEV